MKKLCAEIITFFLLNTVFAVDCREVMFGNNYKNITEINAETFFQKYPQVSKYRWGPYLRVYEQRIEDKVFYRMVSGFDPLTEAYILQWHNILTFGNNPTGTPHPYTKELFMQRQDGSLLRMADTCYMDIDNTLWEKGTNAEYDLTEIISRKGTVYGVMRCRLVDKRNLVAEIYKYINTAEYYRLEDIEKAAHEMVPGLYGVTDDKPVPSVKIEASQPLVDKTRPFMYTIQNAFDGDPATSYVEDTEDDLMEINIDGVRPWITKIAIINGYAKSRELYLANNRITSIADEWIKGSIYPQEKLTADNTRFNLKPDYMGYQIINYKSNGFVYAASILKGKKYSDTCIAELDFYTEKTGWVFGGPNE
jgi:hypothetical protein